MVFELPSGKKFVDVLTDYFVSIGFRREEIFLSGTPSGRVGGYICSPRFAKLRQMERQEWLHSALKTYFSPELNKRVVSILTMTAEEAGHDELADNSPRRRATIVLADVKDSDGWGELATALGLSDEVREAHFRYGEFATLELEIDDELQVVGGRVVPRSG
jgi:hypothetical protein